LVHHIAIKRRPGEGREEAGYPAILSILKKGTRSCSKGAELPSDLRGGTTEPNKTKTHKSSYTARRVPHVTKPKQKKKPRVGTRQLQKPRHTCGVAGGATCTPTSDAGEKRSIQETQILKKTLHKARGEISKENIKENEH